MKFTDLYMDEDKFEYTIEFIFDGQNPSAGGIWNGANAAIKVIVEQPISPSRVFQFLIIIKCPSQYPRRQRRLITRSSRLECRCAYYAAMNHSEPVGFYRGEVSLGFAK